MNKLFLIIICLFLFVSCSQSIDSNIQKNESEFDKIKKTVESRLSCAVSFGLNTGTLNSWLQDPYLSKIETSFYFEKNLGEGVIIGFDQEYLDGVDNPNFHSSGDWMSFVGILRSGQLWITKGTEKTMEGKPSSDRDWGINEIEITLEPNTWYTMSQISNFNKREFVQFSIVGPGINKTVDLSKNFLDFPNAIKFDGRAMTYYPCVISGKALGANINTNSQVYFDDFSASFLKNGETTWKTLMSEGFEDISSRLITQPIPTSAYYGGSILLENYEEGVWYSERDESLCRVIESEFAKNGEKVMLCDGTLRDVNYDNWFNHYS